MFPEADRDFTLTDTEIDKQGNIHFIAKLRMDKTEKKESGTKARYFNKVYSFFYENEELKEYDIQFKNDIIRTLDLDVNEKDELLGVGFYSAKKLSSGYKGLFYLRIDPKTKEVVATNKTAFSKDLIEQLAGKRKAKKGKMPAYVIRKSIPLDNGGFCVVAEDYLYTQSTDANGNTSEMWRYGNVVVMFLDKEGKMTTASVIKKNQLCTAKNGSASILQQFGVGIYTGVNELAYYGISVIEKDDDIFIMYNENPKNEARLKDGKKPKSVRQRTSVTQMMTIKKNGDMHKSVLFKSKDKKAGVKMPLMPRSYTQYSNESTLVLGRKGKTMRATRITIK